MKYTMSDGRAFTNYFNSCDIDKVLQEKYKITNSHEYRYFLQRNAEKIQQGMMDDVKQDCVMCPVCKQSLDYKP